MRIFLQAQHVFEREKGTQFVVKLPVFRKNKCSYLRNDSSQFKCWEYCFQALLRVKIAKIFQGLRPREAPTVFGTNQLCYQCLDLLGFFSVCNIFPIIDLCSFFTSEIGPDIPMNVLEDCIILLIWAAWCLFNFYLKQNQRLSISLELY